MLGSEIHGLSIGIPTNPSLFELAEISKILITDNRADIGNIDDVTKIIGAVAPEIIFHLAAQPLVIEGYRDPLGTFRTNVMGTANVIEAAVQSQIARVLVVVTTDKVYKNLESPRPYCESDPLGGTDPYSASKSAAELVVGAYRQIQDNNLLQIFTARAGNVVGGGDWSPWRLVPDIIKSLESSDEISVRNPAATRPWQHVLDPLIGYLLIVETAMKSAPGSLEASWNFGPREESERTVRDLIIAFEIASGKTLPINISDQLVKEQQLLSLNSMQAIDRLNWYPLWDFRETVKRTYDWYKAYLDGGNMTVETDTQIAEYLSTSDR